MGSRSTQKTEIPAYIEEAGKLALERAKQIQGMGYIPYMGPEVAAINPYEQASAANVASMASAFGMQAPAALDMGGMPTVTQGGMTGYSSYPAYMASLERLRATRPEMYEYLSGMTRFDPITGALNPDYDAQIEAISQPQVATPTVSGGGGNDDNGSTHEAILRMHGHTPSSSNANLGPRDSSPRPVLRGQSTGSSGGLLSGIRSAREGIKDTILDALGVV